MIPALPSALRSARRVACALFALGYGGLSLLRYSTYHSRSLDMAYYVRLVWGMAHGRPDNPVVGAPHWLGLHLEPILFVFAALSRLGIPIAEMLLVAQALVAALALIPVHALARRRLAPVAGEPAALLAALSIYLIPTVSRCVDYDFHPTTMLIAPLCAWIDAIDGGRLRRSWIWLAVCLSFREDVGAQVCAALFAFALLPRLGLAAGARRAMLQQAAVGAAWFIVYAFAIQPRFLPGPASGSFGAHFDRFGGGAGGVAGVLGAALSHPLALARYLVSGDRMAYLPALLLTLGFIPLASPRWLAGALPVFAINLLSDFPGVRRVQSHYATAMAPFFVAAAIEGAARLGDRWGRWRASLRLAPMATLLIAAATAWWLRGAAPGSPDFNLAAYPPDAYTGEARARAAELAGAPRVVAEMRLLAHLAERPEPLLDPAQRLYWKK